MPTEQIHTQVDSRQITDQIPLLKEQKIAGRSFENSASLLEKTQILIRKLPIILSLLGIPEAQISFIEHKGEIHHGNHRLPILIRAGKEKYVAKFLQDRKASEEIELQKTFSGRLAPKIILAGKSMLIEEYIDPAVCPSLEEIAKNHSLNEAIRTAVPAFVEMASQGYGYDHGHWLDELRVRSDSNEVVILDWGTAHKYKDNLNAPPKSFFDISIAMLSKNWDIVPPDDIRRMEQRNLTQAEPTTVVFDFISGAFVMSRDQTPEAYDVIRKKLAEIQATPVFTLQLLISLGYVLDGLIKFLDKNQQSNDPWRDVWPYFATFLEEFVDQYNARVGPSTG